MIKTLLLIALSAISGALFNAYQPFIEPEVVTIDNWQQTDGERMIQKNKCESQKYDIRKENEEKFQEALEAREAQCNQWEVCDCKSNVTIIESNCDTTELTDTLEQCEEENKVLTTQIYNLIYTK